jgi:glycosyltransferase involved in cell wall biosynthesis
VQTVFKQTCLPNEIIIADDGSTEETAKLIDKLKSQSPVPIRHIWHEDKGFRKTLIMNKAIKSAQYDYIVQLDGDAFIGRNFIKDHLKTIKKGYFISGSRALTTKELSDRILKNNMIKLSFFAKGLDKRYYAIRFPFLDSIFKVKPNHVSTIIGCNLSFWKADFLTVNGYNNDIEGWGHEDVELITRFIKYGIACRKLRFSAICFHIYHAGNSRDNESKNFKIYKDTFEKGSYICENGVTQS